MRRLRVTTCPRGKTQLLFGQSLLTETISATAPALHGVDTRALPLRETGSPRLPRASTGKQTGTGKGDKERAWSKVAAFPVLVESPIRCSRQDAKWSQVQPRTSHPSLDAPPLPLCEDRGCLQLEHVSTLSLYPTTKATIVPIALSAFPNGGSHQCLGV